MSAHDADGAEGGVGEELGAKGELGGSGGE